MPRLAQAQELSEVVAKIEAGDALTVVEAKIMEGGIQKNFYTKKADCACSTCTSSYKFSSN